MRRGACRPSDASCRSCSRSLALPAATAAAAPRATPIQPLTLAAVDRTCFYAPPTVRATFWPVQPSAETYTIRGGFNDLRGGEGGDEPPGGHFGIDIEAQDQAPVYAVISRDDRRHRGPRRVSSHFDIGDYQYWHVDLDPAMVDGTKVQAGQRVGTVHKGMKHVHLSERVEGCGWVDPRRPSSPFRLPQDDERASIGGLRALRGPAPSSASTPSASTPTPRRRSRCRPCTGRSTSAASSATCPGSGRRSGRSSR